MNNRLLFPIVFIIFCNLIIPKQGSKFKIFFLKQVVEILKKWAPPHQVTFKCPPPRTEFPFESEAKGDNLMGVHQTKVVKVWIDVYNLDQFGVLSPEHLVVLLAGPISHTSTQYGFCRNFKHFTGFVNHSFAHFSGCWASFVYSCHSIVKNALACFLEYKIVCFITGH